MWSRVQVIINIRQYDVLLSQPRFLVSIAGASNCKDDITLFSSQKVKEIYSVKQSKNNLFENQWLPWLQKYPVDFLLEQTTAIGESFGQGITHIQHSMRDPRMGLCKLLFMNCRPVLPSPRKITQRRKEQTSKIP